MNRRIRRGISCQVLVFPPAAPVTVALDGRRVADYVRAQLAGGRVYAPLSLLRMLVDRMWIDGGSVFVERAGRRTRLPFAVRFCGNADVTCVEIGPVLRALGDSVYFRAPSRTLEVRTPPARPVASAQPFRGTNVPVRDVFTPEPQATPRPTWSGSPLPRRTALPALPPERRRAKEPKSPKASRAAA